MLLLAPDAGVGAARSKAWRELRTIMQKLPTLFISHGSPMHAINAGAAGKVVGL